MLLKFSSFKILNHLSAETPQSGMKVEKSEILNLILIIISFYSLLFAGAPDTLWTKVYGGDSLDVGLSVQQTSDGGFIIAGSTKSFGAGRYDVYLLRTDSNGDTLWTKTYGDSLNDIGNSIQQTKDRGFIIAGETSSYGVGNRDIYLIRTNSTGDTVWTKTYGGTEDDFGFSVKQTIDSGFIIAGCTNSFNVKGNDAYIIRTNSEGDTLWSRIYGGDTFDLGNSVQQTSNGGFIIAGGTTSFGAGSWDFYIIHLNSEGDSIWVKTYGGDSLDVASSIQQTSDGGFIICGETKSSVGSGERDIYLIRTNSIGDTLWTKTYGGIKSEFGNSVQQTSDGGFIIAGDTQSFGVDVSNVYIIRTNSNGDTLWTKTYSKVVYSSGYSIQQTSDDGFIVVGATGLNNSNTTGYVYLIRLDKETIGIQDENPYNFLNPKDFIISYNNNNLISIHYTIQNSSPVNLSMYNISGQKVKTLFNEYKNAGDYFINFKTDKISAGVFYFKLYAGESSYTRKAVVVR